MAKKIWTDYINELQLSYLPVAMASIGVFVFLGTFRDVIFTDFQPPIWILMLNGIGLTAFMTTYALLAMERLKARYAETFLLICFLAVCARPTIIFWFDRTPASLVLPSVMFATGLVFMSLRYVLISQGFTLLVWVVAVFENLWTPQYAITLLVSANTGVLAIWLQHTRLKQIHHNFELENRVEKLETILPMCSSCKKTRDTKGRWMSIEEYLEAEEEAQISHALCPICKEDLYGDYLRESAAQKTDVVSHLPL